MDKLLFLSLCLFCTSNKAMHFFIATLVLRFEQSDALFSLKMQILYRQKTELDQQSNG